MNCQYIHEGVVYNSIEDLLSKVNGTAANLTAEQEWINSVLPGVPVRIANTLMGLPGNKVAEGMFSKGVITLMKGAKEGVGYHEAFHAVTQMYLTDSELDKLYSDVMKKEGAISRRDAEEFLAEEFRSYMKNRKTYPSKIVQWLFDQIEKLLNFCREDKYKLFTKIATGGFRNSATLQRDNGTFFSATDSLRLRADERKAIIDFSVFSVIRKLEKETSLTEKELFTWLKGQLVANQKSYLTKGDTAKANLFERAASQYGVIVPMVKMKLTRYDVVTSKDKEDDTDTVGVTRFTLESNEKDLDKEGSGLVKKKLDFLYDVNVLDPLTGYPKFQDIGTPRRLLRERLAGIVSDFGTEGKTAYDKMVDTVEDLATSYTYLTPLLKDLRSTDPALLKFQSAFFSEFSVTNNSYITSLYKTGKDGIKQEMLYPDTKGKAKILADQVNEFIKDEYFTEQINGDKVTYDWIPDKKVEFRDSVKLIKEIDTRASVNKRDFTEEEYEILSEEFGKLGLPFYQELNKLAKEKLLANKIKGVSRHLAGLNTIFNQMLSRNTLGEDFQFLEQEISKPYFDALAELEGDIGSNTILVGDKIVFTKTQNTYLTKTMSRLHSDPVSWANYILGANGTFSNDSLILNGIRNAENPKKFFQAKLYASLQANHKSTDFQDLSDVDEAVDRMVLSQKGWFAPVAFADKKSMYFFRVDENLLPTAENMFKEDGSYSDKILDTFTKYFNTEVRRIKEVKAHTGEKIDNYHSKTGGESFHLFPGMNFVEGSKDPLHNKIWSVTGEVIYDPSDRATSILLHKFLSKVLNERIQAEKDYAREIGILKGEGTTLDLTPLVPHSLKGRPKEEAIHRTFGEYTVRNMIMNIEALKIFIGDPAYYKNIADLSKRTPAIIAPGYDMKIASKNLEDSTYTVAVSNEVEISLDDYAIVGENGEDTTILKQYHEIFKEYFGRVRGKDETEAESAVTDLLSPYDNVEMADGFAMIRPARYRAEMIGLGEWDMSPNSPQERAYARLTDPNGKVTNDDVIFMQPVKGMHFEVLQGGLPVYLKMSEAVIWPALVKGTPLQNVLEEMERPKEDGRPTDLLVMKSGIKVGAHKKNDLNLGKDKNYRHFTVNNENWKKQQKLPTKYAEGKGVLTVSPLRKMILSNLQHGENYSFMGNMVSGETIADMLYETELALSNLGLSELKAEWNITEDSTPNEIRQAVTKSVIRKLQMDEAPDTVIAALKSGIPFEAIPGYANKLEQELMSKVSKASVKQKANGGGFIQISSLGLYNDSFGSGVAWANLDQNSKDGIIYLNGGAKLQPPRIENGKVRGGQVFLPQRVIKDIPGAYDMEPAELKKILLDSGIMEGLIACRIPLQGPSFIDLLEIAGILPECAGDSMVVYGTMPAKNGSDFDIDKLFIYMPNYEVALNEDGSFKSLTKVDPTGDSRAALENRKLELYRTILENRDKFIETVTPADSAWLKDNAYWCRFMSEEYSNLSSEQQAEFNSLGVMSKAQEKYVTNFYKGKKLGSLEWFSPSYQMKVKQYFGGGKTLVGIAANHISNHVLGQRAELGFNSKVLGRRAGGDRIDFSKMLDESKNNIFDSMSAVLSGAVDIAKDPYIFFVNMNTFTANTMFAMMRAGVDPKYINLFMSQPIVKELASDYYKANSRITKNKKSLSELEEALFKRKGLSRIEKAITLDNLTIQDLYDGLAGKSDKVHDAKVLKCFMAITAVGAELGRVINSTKTDTEGAGQNTAESIITAEMRRELLDKDNTPGSIFNYNKLLENTDLSTFVENGPDFASTHLFKWFAKSSQDCINVAATIFSKIGSDYVNNEKLMRKIQNGYYTYKLSSIPGFKMTTAEIEGLFFGKDNIGKRALAMQKLFKKKGINNLFVKNIVATPASQFRSKKKYAEVTILSTKKKDGVDFDLLSDAFGELLSMDGLNKYNLTEREKTAVSKLAEDLVKYQFYATGFESKIGMFFDIIPPHYLKDLGIIEALSTDTVEAEDFITKFFLNNLHDNSFCKDTTADPPKVNNGIWGIPVNKASALYSSNTPAPYIKWSYGFETQYAELIGVKDNWASYVEVAPMNPVTEDTKTMNYVSNSADFRDDHIEEYLSKYNQPIKVPLENTEESDLDSDLGIDDEAAELIGESVKMDDGFLFKYKEFGYDFELEGLESGDIILSLLTGEESIPFNYNEYGKKVRYDDASSAIIKAHSYLKSMDKDELDNTIKALLDCK